MGVKNSLGDIILIMNPDVRMVEPLFKKAVNYFDSNKEVALLGMKQWYNKGKEGLSFDVDPSYSFCILFMRYKSRIYNKLSKFDNRDMYIMVRVFYLQAAICKNRHV